jgi:ankyrin repeat protein
MVRPLLAAGVVPPSAVLSAGSVPMLRLLVSYKFRATVRGPGGDTALHGAASWGARKELLRELVRLGVPVDARDDKGQTPLFLASFRLWTVKDLLALGANADARDFTGGSVLHFSYVKEPTMIRALISGGANVNGKDFEGNQPLHIRLRNATLGPDGIESAVSALLGSGARVNDANWWGETSLISLGLSDAPDDKATRLVSALLRKGANVRARDKQGRTALHLVTGRVEMTTALLAARADPNAPDANGDTPLHRVVETRFPTHIEQLEVARRLIIAGADPLRPNHEGRTPLANASGCNSESRALFELLRKSAGPARTNLGD